MTAKLEMLITAQRITPNIKALGPTFFSVVKEISVPIKNRVTVNPFFASQII